MSRSKGKNDLEEENTSSIFAREEILDLHYALNHRKTINYEVEKLRIKVTQHQLNHILRKWVECAKKDKKHIKACRYVEVQKPGDKIGIDLIEIDTNNWIIVAIDYFSRKFFAKPVKTKETYKIVKFLQEMHAEFSFLAMISDNGKEFSNEKVEE